MAFSAEILLQVLLNLRGRGVAMETTEVTRVTFSAEVLLQVLLNLRGHGVAMETTEVIAWRLALKYFFRFF